MKNRGRRTRRNLLLHVLNGEGMLNPSTGPLSERVRAGPAERAHIDRLRVPDNWPRPPSAPDT